MPVSATVTRTGDIEVTLKSLGTVASSNSVMFRIAEDYCQKVTREFDAHQEMPVVAEDRQGKRFGHGFVVGVDNEIDTATGTLKCRASLTPKGENLMIPGLFLNIKIILGVEHGVTLIPADAIFYDTEGPFAWVIEPNQTVSQRRLQLGAADGDKTEVKSGLSPGEMAVTGPANIHLKEGQKIDYYLKIDYEQVQNGNANPPSSQNAANASNANLTVAASGNAPVPLGLGYQWYVGQFLNAYPSRVTGPPFVARLNQGSVELLAIADMPWSNTACWLADGTISSEPFPTGKISMDVRNFSDGMIMKKTAFRIHDESSNGPVSFPVCRFDEESGVTGGSYSMIPASWYSWDAIYYQSIACPTNATTMNVSLGIANGAWETATTLGHPKTALSGAGANGQWSASYNAIVGSSGEVAFNFNYNRHEDLEIRMVSVDDNGQITVVPENSSRTSALETGGILLVSSNEFAHIKEFRLQRRKYQWVEFSNVSLQPGYRTTVTVKDADEGIHQSTPAATGQADDEPTAPANDEVTPLKLQIADNELEIARDKFKSEVLSQAAGDLSVTNIVMLMQRAYATIYTYRDSGLMVTQNGRNVWTNQFSELLSRRNYYRIKVVTAANSISRTNRWWSDGDTEFWQPDGLSISKNAHPGTEFGHLYLSLVNPDSAIPALFYHLNWGNILATVRYNPPADLVRLKDETVNGVDCYVLQLANLRLTVWVGKRDFLIRRYRNFIFTETHENIVVNENLQLADFIPPVDGAK